jgi:GNAT superfamily N-acetyltransferase
MDAPITIRTAGFEDIATLDRLIPESVRKLQAAYYTPSQMEAAIGSVFGVDHQLVKDGTYFVAVCGNTIVGCGGWSRRQTLYGSGAGRLKEDPLLDPERDPARIRAFFVHPNWTRRGIGTRLMQACEDAALSAGFQRLELAATLAGVPLFAARGFVPEERFGVPLANGEVLPVVRMSKTLLL